MGKRVWDFLTKAETLRSLGTAVISTGVFNWLLGYWPWLASQGWAAVLAVSVVMTSLVIIALTGGYWAVHTFRKGRDADLGQKADRCYAPSDGEKETEREVNENEDKAQTPHVRFDPRGLYIGNIDIDTRLIEEKSLLTIMVSGFNASGCGIDIREVRGRVRAKVKELDHRPSATFDDVSEFEEMLIPSIDRWTCELADIQNFSEFYFKIIQNVPTNMLDHLRTSDFGRRIALDFAKLDVMVYPTEGSKACRLPLWSGADFHLSPAGSVKVHRVVSANPLPAGARGVAGLGSG